MTEEQKEILTKIKKWCNRQLEWLDSQITMIENLKSKWMDGNIDELDKLLNLNTEKNKKLEVLLHEYEIVLNEISKIGLTKNAFAELVDPIKNKITLVINLNHELIQIIQQKQNNLEKEIKEFYELKHRFLGYTSTESSNAKLLDYDT